MKENFLKEHDFYLGNDVPDLLIQTCRQGNYSKIVVLCDRNTFRHCLPVLSKGLKNVSPIVVAPGERSKNLKSVALIVEHLLKIKADRHTLMLCLGGGMICDLGGFAASIYKRGIAFWNIPTSLLAMVDASIGGKTGIDFEGHKNVIGVFHKPKKIWVYPGFLKTLPEKEILNAKAEILKHCLLEGKLKWKEALNILSEKGDIPDWIIRDSAHFKMHVTLLDPIEKGPRKMLNFGHTIGHAVESWSLQNKSRAIPHGEAVAIGMAAALYLSRKLTNLPERDFQSAVSGIRSIFPYRKLNAKPESLMEWMYNDKKNSGGTIRFVLLERIGKPVLDVEVYETTIMEAIQFYQNSHD